jgi:hypothetical protein
VLRVANPRPRHERRPHELRQFCLVLSFDLELDEEVGLPRTEHGALVPHPGEIVDALLVVLDLKHSPQHTIRKYRCIICGTEH